MTVTDPAQLKAPKRVRQFVRICECGCGQPTNVATETHNSVGVVKGQPQRYLVGHSTRKGHLDTDAIAALYQAGAPLQVVAAEFNTTPATIVHRLGEAGVPTRSRMNFGIRNGRWVETPSPGTGRSRARHYYSNPKPCERCGSTDQPQRHHRGRNPANNESTNIEWLCAPCHAREHRASERAEARGIYGALAYVDEWCVRFVAGESAADIARSAPYSYGTVRRWLIEYGVFDPWRPGSHPRRAPHR
jgi:hypothetical protein